MIIFILKVFTKGNELNKRDEKTNQATSTNYKNKNQHINKEVRR